MFHLRLLRKRRVEAVHLMAILVAEALHVNGERQQIAVGEHVGQRRATAIVLVRDLLEGWASGLQGAFAANFVAEGPDDDGLQNFKRG